jgi:hypothetical protein
MVSSSQLPQEGKQNLMLYLAGLPLWEAILLVVVLPTIIAVCGQIVVRKSVGLEQLTTNQLLKVSKIVIKPSKYKCLACKSCWLP